MTPPVSREPMRLVKLLLPPDLVRQMDRAILASAGAYQDRNEFVTEAVRDRLTEDVAAQVGAGRHVSVRELSTSTAQPDGLQMFGRWRAGAPCTVDAPPGTGVNFGLHNRDLPSLWALDRLAAMTLGQGGPVAWSDFTEIVGRDALALGELLRMHDLGQPSGLRAGVGFPKPGAKADRSVERFLAGNVGTNGRRPEGPFVVLSLAAFIDPDHQSIAPARTRAGRPRSPHRRGPWNDAAAERGGVLLLVVVPRGPLAPRAGGLAQGRDAHRAGPNAAGADRRIPRVGRSDR